MGIFIRASGSLCLLSSLLLSGCGASNTSGNGAAQNASSGTFSGGAFTGGAFSGGSVGSTTPSGGTSAPLNVSSLTSALDQAPTENPQQDAALADVKSGLQDLAKASSQISAGGGGSQAAEQRYVGAFSALAAIARQLDNAGFAAFFVRAIRRLSLIRPLFRFYNEQLGRHFYTTNPAEGAQATFHGFGFQGVGFFVYASPFESCQTPLYRCADPVGNYWWVTTNAACDGNINGRVNQGIVGYACPTQSAESLRQITQMSNNLEPLTTIVPEREPPTHGAAYVVQAGLAFAPN